MCLETVFNWHFMQIYTVVSALGETEKKNTLWNSLKCPESATESSYVCVIIDFFPLFFFSTFFISKSLWQTYEKPENGTYFFWV